MKFPWASVELEEADIVLLGVPDESGSHAERRGTSEASDKIREAGIEGIHEFSETKTVYIDYSGRLQGAQIDIE